MFSLRIFVLAIWFSVSVAMANDWTAFSTIEKQSDGKAFKETIVLVNSSAKTVTLDFPNFQFEGHGDTPAESVGPMGTLVLAPAEAVRFIHIVPVDRKNGFASNIGIQDVAENIPIIRYTVKEDFDGGR